MSNAFRTSCSFLFVDSERMTRLPEEERWLTKRGKIKYNVEKEGHLDVCWFFQFGGNRLLPFGRSASSPCSDWLLRLAFSEALESTRTPSEERDITPEVIQMER